MLCTCCTPLEQALFCLPGQWDMLLQQQLSPPLRLSEVLP
jgi:hypothetical protein